MSDQFERVVAIMAQLRAPGGCPWDRKQTHESLKPYLMEETYEALDAIDRGDLAKLKEELGDVLLQVLFHSQIGTEQATFTIHDVLQQLGDKLVRRHPHVFGETDTAEPPLNSDQVLHRWEDIKRAERKQAGKPESVLHDIPLALPALLRAYQTQVRAARAGFDWPDGPQGLAEIFAKIAEQPTTEMTSELGDVLFSLVNLARRLKVNPEESLRQTTNRFTNRFHFIEQQARRNGQAMNDLSLAEMDAYWDEAKRQETLAPQETAPLPPPLPGETRASI